MKVGVMILGIWILSIANSFAVELKTGLDSEYLSLNHHLSTVLYANASRFEPHEEGRAPAR